MRHMFAALALSVAAVLAAPNAAGGYLNGCTKWQLGADGYHVGTKTRCDNQVNGGPSDPYPRNEQRAYVTCTDGVVRYGAWVKKGVNSEVYCGWGETALGGGWQRR